MKQPHWSYQDFLRQLSADQMDVDEKLTSPVNRQLPNEKASRTIESLRIKLRKGSARAETIATDYDDPVDKKIKFLIPDLTLKNKIGLILWMRLALFLNLNHSIDAAGVIDAYKKWRSTNGKKCIAVKNLGSNRIIGLDEFILRGLNNMEDFKKIWLPVEGAFPTNRLTKGSSTKEYSGVGRLNYLEVEFLINKAARDLNFEELYYKTHKDENNRMLHEYNGKIESLYNEMCKRYNIGTKKSVFKKIISNFVKTYYRGDRPVRCITKPVAD